MSECELTKEKICYVSDASVSTSVETPSSFLHFYSCSLYF